MKYDVRLYDLYKDEYVKGYGEWDSIEDVMANMTKILEGWHCLTPYYRYWEPGDGIARRIDFGSHAYYLDILEVEQNG